MCVCARGRMRLCLRVRVCVCVCYVCMYVCVCDHMGAYVCLRVYSESKGNLGRCLYDECVRLCG